jgi:hypothetical protein
LIYSQPFKFRPRQEYVSKTYKVGEERLQARMTEREVREDFWRLYRAIRRKDFAAGYSWAIAFIAGIVLAATDIYALKLFLAKEYLSISSAAFINAFLIPLILALYIYSKREARKWKEMVKKARAIMLSTGITIPSNLSVGPDGIVYSGFRGRKSAYRWDEIEAVIYDQGSIYFRMRKKRLMTGHPTHAFGLEYDLKEVALAIKKDLPEDKWIGAREWLDSQLKGNTRKP